MPADPLDNIRLDPRPIDPGPAFTARLRRQIIQELSSLLPARYQQEVATVPETLIAPTITNALQADDAHAYIRWLVDVLDFKVADLHEEPNGGVAHSVLSWRTGNVFVSTRHEGVWGTSGPMVICLAAADDAEVDRLYDQARSGGAEIIQEMHDTDWGSHEFGMRDPEGNMWSIGTYRPPLADAT